MLLPWLSAAEWLEADGLGGFAMGTACGTRTRRYHGLLCTALTPPTGRALLVSGFDAWLETPAGRFAISTQSYRGEVRHPDGEKRLTTFDWRPWPTWRFQLEDGTQVDQELFVPHGQSAVCLRWTISNANQQRLRDARLIVRPFLAARDYHCLQHKNGDLRLAADVTAITETTSSGRRDETRVSWNPYASLPAIISWSNGDYRHSPDWYFQFLYAHEAERGLDCLEDLPSPGELSWDFSNGEAVWLLTTSACEEQVRKSCGRALTEVVSDWRDREAARRREFPSWLHRAADSYIVKRDSGHTIIAGYPWFTDWGRDTFIALRGLCLATGRLDVARSILLRWANEVCDGMLPNRFPDQAERPEFNSVDASLWFVIAVHELLETCEQTQTTLPDNERTTLLSAVENILHGYSRGTRFGIRLDDDGLIAAGQPGVQLTWMDAKVGDWVVTPRIGKPVEVQTLWLNALWLHLRQATRHANQTVAIKWQATFERGLASFRERFWNDAAGCLFDVVDLNHEHGATDAAVRANQVFAAGGLPFTLLEPTRARQVVDLVAEQLWTPLGLRTLAQDSPGYAPCYVGSIWQRDAAYHQGTAWPWLLGAFVEAWVKTRDNPATARHAAFQQFVEPLLAHRYQSGLDHISEIADGNRPHVPRGCPFQAWSVGEILRLMKCLEVDDIP